MTDRDLQRAADLVRRFPIEAEHQPEPQPDRGEDFAPLFLAALIFAIGVGGYLLMGVFA